MHEPPAPIITVTDPNRRGEPVDVVGEDREPWRPSKRLVQGVAVLLVLTSLVVVPVRVLEKRAADHRADRSSVAQLDLTGQHNGGGGDDPDVPSISLDITNKGPAPVRVQRIRLDRDGYAAQSVALRLEPGETSTIEVTLELSCPTIAPNTGPRALLVDVVTDRGLQTTTRVPTGEEFGQAYLDAQLAHCHLYRPSQSLGLTEQSYALTTTRLPPNTFGVHVSGNQLTHACHG